MTTEERKHLFNYGPELVKKEKQTDGDIVDVSILKEQQLEQYLKLEGFSDTPSGMALLRGYAGTGKTFLLGVLINNYKNKYPHHNVAMTAPTNKAVKELRKATSFGRDDIGFATLHSLLGLKESYDKYGRIVFKPDKSKPSKLNLVNLLVVDEVSQLAVELCDMLVPYVEMGQLKIIFTGDPCQIPPVNQGDCLPFQEEFQQMYDMVVCDLTEIIRQAAGNPIIEGTLKIREVLQRPKVFVRRESNITDKGAMVFIERNDPVFEELLEFHFKSTQFSDSSDYAKIVGWTNREVNDMNAKIRRMLYPEGYKKRINIGEKLVMDGPYIEEKKIVLTTNDEIEVAGYSIDTELVNNGDYELKFYSADVDYFDGRGEYRSRNIRILHEDSQKLFDEILEQILQYAKSLPRGGFQAAEAWTSYYEFLRHFAQLKYAYALTAHKAQGSTYRNVFVIEHDIDKDRKVEERNRIKYTAVSRASEKLFVIY